jgi:hypothetical protein
VGGKEAVRDNHAVSAFTDRGVSDLSAVVAFADNGATSGLASSRLLMELFVEVLHISHPIEGVNLSCVGIPGVVVHNHSVIV